MGGAASVSGSRAMFEGLSSLIAVRGGGVRE